MKPKAYIFDVDGTVAIRDKSSAGREPYDMTRVGEDLPNWPVLATAKLLSSAGIYLIFTSGRDDSAADATAKWLEGYGVRDFTLFTRNVRDNRPDDEVKQEMLHVLREHWDIIAAFDDRNRVVKMWRDNDVTCFQVCSQEDGDF